MIIVKPTSRAVRITFHSFRLAAASKPCTITYIFQVTIVVSILTVVGSSKKIKVGLAINASAALTLRLFPPLDT